MSLYKSIFSAGIKLLNNLTFISFVTIVITIIVVFLAVTQLEENKKLKQSIQDNAHNIEENKAEYEEYKALQNEISIQNEIEELTKRLKKKRVGKDINLTSQALVKEKCKKYFFTNDSILDRFNKDGLKVLDICREIVK